MWLKEHDVGYSIKLGIVSNTIKIPTDIFSSCIMIHFEVLLRHWKKAEFFSQQFETNLNYQTHFLHSNLCFLTYSKYFKEHISKHIDFIILNYH